MKAVRIDEMPRLEPDHLLAIQACARGHATSAQQKTALWVILGQLCGLTAIEAASLTEREGGFVAGKRWVGMAIGAYAGIGLYEVRDNAASTDLDVSGEQPKEG